jgi:hypothetical protein
VHGDPVRLRIEAMKSEIEVVGIDEDSDLGAERSRLAGTRLLLGEIRDDGRIRPYRLVQDAVDMDKFVRYRRVNRRTVPRSGSRASACRTCPTLK